MRILFWWVGVVVMAMVMPIFTYLITAFGGGGGGDRDSNGDDRGVVVSVTLVSSFLFFSCLFF